MIVRISTEGQYRLEDPAVAELNQLDNQAVSACEAGDEYSFRSVFEQLLAYVRQHGTEVRSDELVESDLILPPPDVTLEEARSEFRGEGLIPG